MILLFVLTLIALITLITLITDLNIDDSPSRSVPP